MQENIIINTVFLMILYIYHIEISYTSYNSKIIILLIESILSLDVICGKAVNKADG
jgi:hypothetical protein